MTPIEVEHLIKDKCDAWLRPMGYSLHASTQISLMYSNNEPDANWPWPIITCRIEPNKVGYDIRVDLMAGGNSGLMRTEIKGLSFEHPNIIDFISDLRYVANCVQSMRNNPIAKFHINNLKSELQEKLKKDKK